MKKIIKNIENKLHEPGIVSKLVSELSNSELNSLYLELFRAQCEHLTPADVLRQFEQNRFTHPAKIDEIAYKELELEWLKHAHKAGFQPIQLSPLAPLGSCSVVGEVHQNNIVSATRGSEVVSDATNVLALQIASEFKADPTKRDIHHCTTFRHTRAQHFTNPAFSAHFGAFCMVTGGFDRGNHAFELDQLDKHVRFYIDRLEQDLSVELLLKLYWKSDNTVFQSNLRERWDELSSQIKIIDDAKDDTDDYYQTVRIKIFAAYNHQEIDLADLGFVNWSQRLLNNRKHRMLISGAGLELVHNIKMGKI